MRTLGNLLAGFSLVLVLSAPAYAQVPVYLFQWGATGIGDGEFSAPFGVAVGMSGNIYITDRNNGRLQIFGAAGNYLGQCPRLVQPYGVAVGADGVVYVAEYAAKRISVHDSNGGLLGTWGAPGAGPGQFNGPVGVATDAEGRVYVTDPLLHRVQVFTSAGGFITQWGSFDGNARSGPGEFNSPFAVAVGPGGNVYVADLHNHRIQVFTPAGAYLSQWGSLGSGDGQFFYPAGLAFDPAGNVHVLDNGNKRVQIFTSAGAYLAQWGGAGSGNGQLHDPLGLAINSEGIVYVADQGLNRAQAFGPPPTATQSSTWGRVKAAYRQ